MDLKALKEEISRDEYAGMTDETIATTLMGKTFVSRRSRFINKTTVYGTLGFSKGIALMTSFKQLAASEDPQHAIMFSEIIDLLKVESDGIDISLDEVRGVIDMLVNMSILNEVDGGTLKLLGELSLTAPQKFGFDRPIEFGDVARARKEG